MPRHPDVDPAIQGMPGRPYSALAERLARREGPVYPLHVGDTWMAPPEGCRMEDLSVAEHPRLHNYAPVDGLPELLQGIVDWSAGRGLSVQPGQVLVTAGATGGLGAAVGALVEPGDEVLILAPYWPLIAGIVRTFRGVPVPVPFLGARDPKGLVEAVQERLGPRTAALYVNTPHNPTGRVLPAAWLAALVEVARQHDLWLLSDEVYVHYAYAGEHVSLRRLAPERTVVAHSFSKAYGMAGNRCGYVVGPEAVVDAMRKISLHTFYSTPTAAQWAAARALQGPGDAWAARAAAQYEELGRAAAERLGVDPPQGSTFLFLDVAEAMGAGGLMGLLERCVDRGLLVAPGPSFGPFPHHLRLCFTSAEPEVVREGVEVLAGVLGR